SRSHGTNCEQGSSVPSRQSSRYAHRGLIGAPVSRRLARDGAGLYRIRIGPAWAQLEDNTVSRVGHRPPVRFAPNCSDRSPSASRGDGRIVEGEAGARIPAYGIPVLGGIARAYTIAFPLRRTWIRTDRPRIARRSPRSLQVTRRRTASVVIGRASASP